VAQALLPAAPALLPAQASFARLRHTQSMEQNNAAGQHEW